VFGFPIRVKGNAGFKVTELTKALNAKHVETRPIIAGNIARQPALKMYEHRVAGDLKHSNAVMDAPSRSATTRTSTRARASTSRSRCAPSCAPVR